MDKRIYESLKGFESVWRRVAAAKSAAGAAETRAMKLMPKKQERGRAVRYCQGHK